MNLSFLFMPCVTIIKFFCFFRKGKILKIISTIWNYNKLHSATFCWLGYYCALHACGSLLRVDRLPWLCTSATLPGSWWHHRRHKGSLLCVSPPTTPRPPQTTRPGSHPTSRPSTWRPSWLWSQHAAGPAARSSTWWGQDLVNHK